MNRVTGIGGIFFKVDDRKSMAEWYRSHLGIDVGEGAFAMFPWRHDSDPEKPGATIWALFPRDTDYFSPGNAPFMINYRVDDLDAVLTQLRAEGVQVDERIEDSDFGRFGWIVDPEGNRIELWQPPPQQ